MEPIPRSILLRSPLCRKERAICKARIQIQLFSGTSLLWVRGHQHAGRTAGWREKRLDGLSPAWGSMRQGHLVLNPGKRPFTHTVFSAKIRTVIPLWVLINYLIKLYIYTSNKSRGGYIRAILLVYTYTCDYIRLYHPTETWLTLSVKQWLKNLDEKSFTM